MTNINQAKKPQQKNIEKIVKRETIKLIVAGCLFMLVGTGMMVLEIARVYGFIEAIPLGRLSMFGNVIIFMALAIASSRSITKTLIKSSQDEYEYQLDVASKARAYTFLNYSVLITALILGGAGQLTIGLLIMIIGISWIIIARGGGHVDV